MRFDESSLEFLGISAGNLVDFNQDNFAPEDDKIKAVWYKTDGYGENFSSQKTLFKIHFKALEDFCSILDVLEFDNEVLANQSYNNSGNSVASAISLVYQKERPEGTLTSTYPNPVTTSVSFDFDLSSSKTVEIYVSDYLGNMISNSTAYSSGSHTYTFSSLSSLSSGPLNYRVKIGSLTYSGILIKT